MARGVVGIWSHGPVTRAFAIRDEGIVIGRDLIGETTDDRISKQHARLERVGERVRVTDAGSRNGTFVNGHQLDVAGVEIDVGGIIRTGRTLWAISTDVSSTEIVLRVREILGVIEVAEAGLTIHAGFIEACLLWQDAQWLVLDAVRRAAHTRAAMGGMLRGEDLDPVAESRATMHAVFPGIESATRAAKRLAVRIEGATVRPIAGGNALVEASRGERRVTITCPPSTAYLVDAFDGAILVASGHTLVDDEAIAAAQAWLERGEATATSALKRS